MNTALIANKCNAHYIYFEKRHRIKMICVSGKSCTSTRMYIVFLMEMVRSNIEEAFWL